MKTIARLSVSLVSLIALSLAACGGRTAAFEDEDGDIGPGGDTGTTSESGGAETGTIGDDTSFDDDGPWVDVIDPDDVFEEDTSVVFDTSTPIVDTGTPIKDTGVISSDTGLKDTGVISSDTGLKDTGVISTDTGLKDTGVIDTGSVDAGSIYATCAKIASATCTPAFQVCCTSKGFKYDALGCDDVSRNWCDDAVDGVVAGRTKYNEAFADACAASRKTMTTSCSPELFDWVKSESACSQLFNGTVSAGGPCTRSTECHANSGEAAWCDETAKRCRAYSVVGLGAACNYFGATIRWCDKGLTCDVSAGKCVTATPIGGSCFGADDTQCGLGNSCKSGKCAVGAAPGASCTRDLECASWSCEFGKCTDIRVDIANKASCGGI